MEDGTVLLDISGLDSLRMQDDSHAVIGAGIKLGPLYLGLHQNGGRAFPAGVCPAVGAGGHLTGRQLLPAVLMTFFLICLLELSKAITMVNGLPPDSSPGIHSSKSFQGQH